MKIVYYFAAAAAIIVFIYLNTPADTMQQIVVEGQVQERNWSSLNLVGYGGSVSGSFSGQVGNYTQNSYQSMNGRFIGKVFYEGLMRQAELNVTSGRFTGSGNLAFDINGMALATNMTGNADNWVATGRYDLGTTSQAQKPFDYSTIIYIIIGLGAVYLITKWQLGSARMFDENKVEEKLREHLKEKSLQLWRIKEHTPYPMIGPEMINITFQLGGADRGLWCSIKYDIKSGKFYGFQRGINYSDYLDNTTRQTKFVDEVKTGRYEKVRDKVAEATKKVA